MSMSLPDRAARELALRLARLRDTVETVERNLKSAYERASVKEAEPNAKASTDSIKRTE